MTVNVRTYVIICAVRYVQALPSCERAEFCLRMAHWVVLSLASICLALVSGCANLICYPWRVLFGPMVVRARSVFALY